jgi:hypothetical protein
MRIMLFPVAISLALLSSATLAQQQMPGSVGESVGSPPPLPGPPPLAGPPAEGPPATSRTSAPAPQQGGGSSKGYTGANAPASDNPPPVFNGPLPEATQGPGLNVVAPDGVSTRTVKAVPCSLAARETDGTTTCVGIPDSSARRRRR